MNYWPVKSSLFSLSSAAQAYSVNSVAIIKKTYFRSVIETLYTVVILLLRFSGVLSFTGL